MRRGHLRLDGGRPIWVREGAVAVEREAKSGILDKSRQVAVIGIQVLRSVAKARSLDEGSGVLDLRGNKSRRDPASSGQRNRCTCHRGGHTERDKLADRNNKPREWACANRRGT